MAEIIVKYKGAYKMKCLVVDDESCNKRNCQLHW